MISTEETHSVQEFCEVAFGHVDLDWQDYVVQDKAFMRPAEVDLLIGDASKAKTKLGWQSKTPFTELVTMMVDGDLDLVARQQRELA